MKQRSKLREPAVKVPTISAIFSSGPARKTIHRSQPQFRARTNAEKAYPYVEHAVLSSVDAESLGEDALIDRCEFSPDCIWLKAQPLVALIPSKNGAFRSYEDLATIDDDGQLHLHQPKSLISLKKWKTQDQLSLVRDWCRSHGVPFHVWVNDDLYAASERENLEVLRRNRSRAVPEALLHQVSEVIGPAGVVTIGDLMITIPLVDHIDLYALIGKKKLAADLSIPLGYDTRLRLPRLAFQRLDNRLRSAHGVRLDLSDLREEGIRPTVEQTLDPLYRSLCHPSDNDMFPWELAQALSLTDRLLALRLSDPNHHLLRWLEP